MIVGKKKKEYERSFCRKGFVILLLEGSTFLKTERKRHKITSAGSHTMDAEKCLRAVTVDSIHETVGAAKDE